MTQIYSVHLYQNELSSVKMSVFDHDDGFP